VASWSGLKGILGRARRWEQQFPHSDQCLRIEPSVLRYIRRHRQAQQPSREAGGQLFGRVTGDLVTVTHAAGPRSADERRCFTFRSDPVSAQADIERFARRGLLYLGEWHTHAEAIPRPSGSDECAMQQIHARSHLNTTALLLVILGFGEPDEDLGVWYIDDGGVLRAMS
jgi:integrative and conjugative element protein (TIGR02256 family)